MVKQLPLVFRKKKSKEIMEMDNTTVSVRKVFDKEEFKEMVRDNVKTLYRKTVEEASQQQIFQGVCYAVKEAIIDDWLATQAAYKKAGAEKDSLLYVNGIFNGACTWK